MPVGGSGIRPSRGPPSPVSPEVAGYVRSPPFSRFTGCPEVTSVSPEVAGRKTSQTTNHQKGTDSLTSISSGGWGRLRFLHRADIIP